MRTLQHVIDTRSVKEVLNLLPDHWVIRELTERDYGIDLMVEIFEKTGTNQHGHDFFDSTGAIFHIQVKGTETKLSATRDGTFSYSMHKNPLYYAENFSTPFFLFHVDVSEIPGTAYFIWIQRYIKDVLDSERESWRTDDQDSFTVKIPLHNEVKARIEKIEKIASRPKLIQELVEFREIYFHLSNQLYFASNGEFRIDDNSLKLMKLMTKQILNLKTLFKYNECCIDKSCAKDLLAFVNNLTVLSEKSDFSNPPHHENFGLLASSIEGIADIESFIAENASDTVY
jgi:hypothetical protein